MLLALFPLHISSTTVAVCRYNVVGIATRYGLDGLYFEPRWGRDFPHPSRPTLGPNPASCTMGTGSFPGVKRPGRGVGNSSHLTSRLRKE